MTNPTYPEVDVALLQNGTPTIGPTFVTYSDPNFGVPNDQAQPEVDTALLPGVPGQRGATGPIGPAGAPGVTPVFVMQDNVGVYTGKSRFYFESTRTITSIRASVGTAPTGSPLVVAVLLNGTSIGTVSIPAGSYTATTTLSQVVNLNDYVTVNVTSVGTTTAGSDLTVTLNIT